MPNLITAGGASDSLAIESSNDGALTLRTGPSGAKVNALAFASDGTPTFLKQPVLPLPSMVRLHTANGYGSTNTVIRRFTTTVLNQGTDITYADSATLGATFTINTNGVYAVSYSEVFNATGYAGLSLNTTTPTTNIQSIAAAEILSLSYGTGGAGSTPNAPWTGYLAAGAVIRAHTQGTASGGVCQFTIVRVA
jgi:hypothetical protein